MPLLETLNSPSSASETPRRSTAVGQLLQAATLAFAAALAQPAAAADQQEQRSISAPERVETETPFQRFGRLLDDKAIDAFNDDSYAVRDARFDALIEAIDDGISKTNPLPDEIFLRIKEKRTPDLLPEQDERLRQLFEHALLQEKLNPLRIRCPKAEGTSLAASLSKRFGLPIMAEDPEIAAALECYQEGGEGQTYGEALQRLCDDFGCIPVLRPYGLVLVQHSDAVVRINDYLCQVDRHTPEGRQSEIFLLPNYGAILTAEDDACEPVVWAAMNAVAPWQKPVGQNPDSPVAGFDADSVITYLAAVSPETASIAAQEGASASIGDQAFYIESMTQAQDGSWRTTIKGSWCLACKWGNIFGNQEMHLYQMTAATGYMIETESGDRIGCVPSDLRFNRQYFELSLSTPGKPVTVDIRAFKEYETQWAPLP